MKKLFIYYSLTGNGDIVADALKEKGYEIRKVIPKKSLPKSFFLSIMVGGFKALIKKKDKLINFDSNIDKYDEIIIGSPIWFDRISSPINTVLNKLDLKNQRISFVLYSGGGLANKASERINELYNTDIIILKTPKNNKKELDKLKKL